MGTWKLCLGSEDLLASLTMTEMDEQDATILFARETFDLRKVRFWSTKQAEIEILAREGMPPSTLREH
jgi:hypothetical protein